jgi:hypothetical protein
MARHGNPPTTDQARLERRFRDVARLRSLLPEAIRGSDIVDRRRGPVIRRLLRLAQGRNRAATLAARRGITLWGDTAQRFELLFIERDARSTWLVDEAGARVAWLGGGETHEIAALSVPVVFDPRVPASEDPAVTRQRQRLHDSVADGRRSPKRPGRPPGRRDRRSGRLIGDFDRATHERLAEQLAHARTKLGWRGARVFREAERMDNAAARALFTPAARALLAAIGRRAKRVEILRRIERQFLLPGKHTAKNSL